MSIVRPTRWTIVSNSFYFGMTLYRFRAVLSSWVQDCTYSNKHLSNRYCCLLASKQTAVSVWQMPVAVCTVLNSDDGRKDRPKLVECHSKIKWIWYIDASSWSYCKNNITMNGPMNVKARRLSLASLIQYTPSYLNKCIFIQWQKNLVSFHSLSYRTWHRNPFILYTSVPDRSLTSYMYCNLDQLLLYLSINYYSISSKSHFVITVR